MLVIVHYCSSSTSSCSKIIRQSDPCIKNVSIYMHICWLRAKKGKQKKNRLREATSRKVLLLQLKRNGSCIFVIACSKNKKNSFFHVYICVWETFISPRARDNCTNAARSFTRDRLYNLFKDPWLYDDENLAGNLLLPFGKVFAFHLCNVKLVFVNSSNYDLMLQKWNSTLLMKLLNFFNSNLWVLWNLLSLSATRSFSHNSS